MAVRVVGDHVHDAAMIKHAHCNRNKEAYFAFDQQVYPVATPILIVLRPTVEHLRLEGDYSVMILPYMDFDLSTPYEKLNAHAEDNRLEFSYCFPSEQSYFIIVTESWGEETNLIVRTCLYALETDLYERLPLKGDLHCHTICSDGLESPELVVDTAVRLGFDFLPSQTTIHITVLYAPSVMCASGN